ncbi:MAG: alpha/beta hydrolase [Sphingobacteriales bacterium]|nr:alpha/beta hydrolase [Sphingobacteriales bacterium]
MKKAYFISGLGADKRIFSFLDLSFCEPVFLGWITPEKKETLPHYALRLKDQVRDESPVIAGISFGGMLATEMAKADPSARVIILSSIKTKTEFPGYFRMGKYLPLYKWSPASLSKKLTLQASAILGGTTPEEKKLLHQIIRESDMDFVRWAIGAILRWENSIVPSNLVHIHGTADKLLPFRYVKADYCIDGGTHVMTLDKHQELSLLLQKLIQ